MMNSVFKMMKFAFKMDEICIQNDSGMTYYFFLDYRILSEGRRRLSWLWL